MVGKVSEEVYVQNSLPFLNLRQLTVIVCNNDRFQKGLEVLCEEIQVAPQFFHLRGVGEKKTNKQRV